MKSKKSRLVEESVPELKVVMSKSLLNEKIAEDPNKKLNFELQTFQEELNRFHVLLEEVEFYLR